MIKSKIIAGLTFILLMMNTPAKSQILISLLLGDKLNSDKLEFGLDGGICFLNMSNTPTASTLTDWNLGFYFDFKIKQSLFIHTGVRVKARMGAGSLTPYSLNISYLDSAFVGGSVNRKIDYFNVPVLVRYRLVDYLHVEGGVQLGLRHAADDIFVNTIVNKKDLKYSNDIKSNFTRLDAGLQAGLGYKLKKGTGITVNADYYYGLVDVNTQLEGNQANSAIYVNVSIPIGKNKAEKAGEE